MLKRIAFFLLLLYLMSFNSFAQTVPPLVPGVSQKLAQWRAANYSNVRYKLDLTLEKMSPMLKGKIEIKVDLTEEGAKNDLIIDWRTTQFAESNRPVALLEEINGKKNQSTWETLDHITAQHEFLKTGENIIKLIFTSPIKTSGSAITRYVDKEDGGEYIYSLFVPSDASTAFPCFDQPDLKARFTLTLDVPRGWTAVSNSIWPRNQSEWKSRRGTYQGMGFEFKETEPISTYVFAFAAGNFDVLSEISGQEATAQIVKDVKERGANEGTGIPIPLDELYQKEGTHIYVRRSQAEKFKQHAAEVFRLNREGVKFLEEYFDYKFPFPKYDLVLIPEFPFGGMEHAGATFLREDSVIFPQEPTANNYISRANVIFHEAAHQWFGDTVTMRWFDDLWLKEGFAEFMAYKTLEKVMPQYNAWKTFYERNKQSAYLTDSTRGTTPIYQEIPNLSAAKSAYGNIVYKKAPSFLRQAEFYLGPDKFQTAVRAFLKKHEYANAGWEDLLKEFEKNSIDAFWKRSGFSKAEWEVKVKEFEKNSNGKLKDFSALWIKQKGLYKIRMNELISTTNPTYTFTAKASSELINSREFDASSDLMGFQVLIGTPDGKQTVENYRLFPPPLSEWVGKRPKDTTFIFPNYQDYGYGIFLMDDKSRDYVLKNIQQEKDVFLRAMMWGSLWDSVREQELDPKDYVELVIKNLPAGETDETTISVLLGRVSTAMNYYLPEKQQAELAPRIEDLLIDKVLRAQTMGQKLTYYRAFLGLASTEKARVILKQILRGEFTAPGVKPAVPPEKLPERNMTVALIPMKTKDKFDIVTRLMVLGDKDAPALLAELEKTETTDEAKRYAYAAKAGAASTENKAKFFDDFVTNKTISESWIEAAFGPFNSVGHAETTLPYLEKALAELPNLKRNRKIFFINGWLGAFIGGQRSEQALAIVNKFLAENPNLDKDLRLKILENVDTIERAVKIRAKFNK
jgi:aminopeptidase N